MNQYMIKYLNATESRDSSRFRHQLFQGRFPSLDQTQGPAPKGQSLDQEALMFLWRNLMVPPPLSGQSCCCLGLAYALGSKQAPGHITAGNLPKCTSPMPAKSQLKDILPNTQLGGFISVKISKNSNFV